MVLYIIGLGLGDEKDVTLRGLEAIEKSSELYLESYTSILGTSKEKLESLYKKPVIIADRDLVETGADSIYQKAKDEDISFLVVGDPLCATTHTDLILRARENQVPVKIVYNASVMGAAGACGLQLYSFGYTVSIPFFKGEWRPDSFYERMKMNLSGGMHTLCLLDIKVKEPDYEYYAKTGRTKYLPPRFMSVNCAIDQLLEVEEKHSNEGICGEDRLAVGMARLGQEDEKIVYGTLKELRNVQFGEPLHCLVICNNEIHDLERELLNYYRVKPEDYLSPDSLFKFRKPGSFLIDFSDSEDENEDEEVEN